MDLDVDGDLDAIVGERYGTLKYYQNTGSSTAPLYTEQTGTANPFNGIDVGYFSAPTFADLDGDGDLDAIVGNRDGTLNYFKSVVPIAITQTGGNTQVTEGGATDSYTVVLNGQPTADVVITLNSGTQLSTNVSTLTFTAANWNVAQTVTVTAINDTIGEGTQRGVITTTVTSSDRRFNGLTIPPIQVTIADNDLPTTPRIYVEQTGTANPFNGLDVGFSSKPTFADLDSDGDLDVIVSGYDGDFYYKNTGTNTAPVYTLQTGVNNPFLTLSGSYHAPTLADIDGDGDFDAIVGEFNGTLNYSENTGSAINPVYAIRTGSANPFNSIDVGYASTPTFADLDGDGDLDAIVGELFGSLKYYQNTGSSTAPVYTAQTGASNPFNGINVGTYIAPTFADIDGDGDLDAIVGEFNGTLNYYKNTGSSTTPLYIAQTGANNPFNGIDVGWVSAPTFADLDGDGDLDAIVGESFGNLKYFQSIIPPNSAPNVTSGAIATFAENGTGTVYTATATDPDTGTPLTYSISGTDAALFNINSSTGAVTFKTAPNFEAPTDNGADNAYDINVIASDGSFSDTKAVVITVTNVNQAPTSVTLSNVVNTIAENTSTASRVKVADIAIADDALGTNTLSLTGADATSFEILSNALYIKAGVALNYEAKTSYSVTVNVDDASLGSTPDASTNYNLTLLDRAVFAINDATVVENAGTATFTVTTTDPIATGTATVNYATANGTAFATPFDYTATSGTLTFTGGGATTQTLNVSINNDTFYEELDETFTVNLTNPSNGTIADAQGLGTIEDDDPALTISVSDASIPEGNSGTTNLIFQIVLSAPSGQVVTVGYATQNNTATAGSDYTATSGTLTLQPGATSGVVIVPVLGDTTDTVDESIFLNIANATGGVTILDNQGSGTILNDDGLAGGLTLTGTSSNDILTGASTDDTLTGLAGADNLDGQGGADKFVYNTFTDSLLGGLDVIRNFNPGEGDRLDLTTLPSSVFYVGSVASSISASAVQAAYTAADGGTGLTANEGVFFVIGSGRTARLYLSVNDGTASFDQGNDLVVDVTRMTGAPTTIGGLTVGNYFV